MFNRFMNWLIPKLETRLLKTGQYINITGTDAPDDVYLRRCFLFRSKLFSVYIHRFLRSDRDDHHDHPFDFVSYIVKGGYKESLMVDCMGRYEAEGSAYDGIWHPLFKVGERKQGSWALRLATAIHMVFLDKEYKSSEADQAPLTVVFRGPYRREWGFWKWYPMRNGIKWVQWNEYLGVPAKDRRE